MTLTATERAQVEAAGEKLFNWERLAEEHSVVLRKDPNAYAEAWEQYNATAPPIGTVPPLDKYEEHILLGERVLEKECLTFLDHVEAATTLIYLCRLQMTLNFSKLSRPVQKAILEYVTAKHTKHQYKFSQAVIPEHPHPLLREFFNAAPTSSSQAAPPPLEYPDVLPGQPFSWTDIAHYPRAWILPEHLAMYQSHPESLSPLTFAVLGAEEEVEAFRVASFLVTAGKETLYYLVFSDGGAKSQSPDI